MAAGDAISRYGGWKKGKRSEPPRLEAKRASMKAAREAGVTFVMGGDAGVFAHGDNALEMELLVNEYGFTPLEVLRQATSGNANAFSSRGSRPHSRGSARGSGGGGWRSDARHERRPAGAPRDERRHHYS